MTQSKVGRDENSIQIDFSYSLGMSKNENINSTTLYHALNTITERAIGVAELLSFQGNNNDIPRDALAATAYSLAADLHDIKSVFEALDESISLEGK